MFTSKPLSVILGLVFSLFAISSGPGLKESPSGQTYLLLATERSSTMQKEIHAAAAEGYRVVFGSPSREGDEMAYFLKKSEDPLPPSHYLLLSTNRLKTMQEELNEAASRGYRLNPRTVMWQDSELILLMELSPDEDSTFDYRVLGTHRTSTLMREVNEAAAYGYELVMTAPGNENVAIMVRVSGRSPVFR
jgi:hypothetical protein